MRATTFEHPTPEEGPFVEAICATPGDYGARAVFADWLEERGDRRVDWLRATLTIEQAVADLGWGYAYPEWRRFLPELLPDDDGLKRALATCDGYQTPTWEGLPELLRRSLTGHRHCGGFIERVRIGIHGLAIYGDELRRLIPLREVDLLSGPSGLPQAELTDYPKTIWRGVERIENLTSWALLAPFQSVERARQFADRTGEIKALSTGAFVDHDALCAFLNAKPIESFLFQASGIVSARLEPLLDNWQPSNLRCLGIANAFPTLQSIESLAQWPSLAHLRLLYLPNSRLAAPARHRIARSKVRHPDLCVVYEASRGRSKLRVEGGVRWIAIRPASRVRPYGIEPSDPAT